MNTDELLTNREKDLRDWLREQPGGSEKWLIIKAGFRRSYDAGRDEVVAKVEAAAEGWTTATCQTDGAPCSWHRVAAECAQELRVALGGDC